MCDRSKKVTFQSDSSLDSGFHQVCGGLKQYFLSKDAHRITHRYGKRLDVVGTFLVSLDGETHFTLQNPGFDLTRKSVFG